MSHSLRDEEKLRWLDAYKDFLRTDTGDPGSLNTILNGDVENCGLSDANTGAWPAVT